MESTTNQTEIQKLWWNKTENVVSILLYKFIKTPLIYLYNHICIVKKIKMWYLKICDATQS